jgi:hypothetical protein
MESWIHENLEEAEVMLLSDIGYTNDKIGLCILARIYGAKSVDSFLRPFSREILLHRIRV